MIPRYRDFHGAVVSRAIHQPATPGALWIELGCGTGELSRRLLEALPDVRLHAIDLSDAMLERAREKLAPWSGRVTFERGNALQAPLPPGAAGVVSALAIHHLDGAEKRALFARLARTLAPGGLFLLADAVDGETPAYTAYYRARWADHMRASGLSEEEVRGILDDHERNDRFSRLSEQMAWLGEAGFERVECLWKHELLVVVAAERQGR